jgi:hypothetical protein
VAEGARLLASDTRSADAERGEDAGLLPSPSPRRIIGEWPCGCGQRYRVLTEPLTFWAKNSRDGYQRDPVADCISCGVDLAESFGLEAARLATVSLIR